MTTSCSRSSGPPEYLSEVCDEDRRILIVDCEIAVLYDLAGSLRELGWIVETAESIRRALNMAQRSTYGVVLTDAHTLVDIEQSLIEPVRRISPHTTFVLLTTNSRASTLNELGIRSVNSRPWHLSSVIKAVRTSSEEFRLRQAGLHLVPSAKVSQGKVLLIDSNETDALRIERFLSDSANYEISRVRRLSEASSALHASTFDFILTDLTLPDAQGFDVINWLQDVASVSAVLVLSDKGNENLALEAVQRGAQDFLLKEHLDAERLASSMRFAHERKLGQRVLEQLAHEDPLTGLFNRRMFCSTLTELVQRAHRSGHIFAVLFIDLDHFKPINDQFGHEVGDEILREAARRITSVLRPEDSAARLGGDEFAILLERLDGSADALAAAQQLVAILGSAYATSRTDLKVTASIGIAMYPGDASTGEELLNCADVAMYEVKRSSRNDFHLYQGCRTIRPGERPGDDFFGALNSEEFCIYYQPKWDLRSQTLVGFEALIRWKRGEVIVAPAEFIDDLEKSDAIVAVGAWVLDTACKRLAEWRRKIEGLHMAINVSARQFEEGSIVQLVERALERYHLPASSLELEITERLLLEDCPETQTSLAALKALGVQIAVDDFGTGFSSLAYLSRLPVTTLKIDRSFVSRSLSCPGTATVTKTIVELGHRLGLQVVAEGVETPEQLEFLAEIDCDQAQGFWLGRPSTDWPAKAAEFTMPPVSGCFSLSLPASQAPPSSMRKASELGPVCVASSWPQRRKVSS